jgi:hypothetical protein
MRRFVSWRDWERSELTSDTKRGCRFSLLTFLCVVAAVCGALAFLRWYFVRESWIVTTVSFPNGEELVIREEMYWEVGINYDYEVRLGEHVVVPRKGVDTVAPENERELQVLKSKDNQVVGVRWKGATRYLCLHDSSTGKTWPYDPLDRPSDRHVRLQATKRELIRKLEAGDGK